VLEQHAEGLAVGQNISLERGQELRVEGREKDAPREELAVK